MSTISAGTTTTTGYVVTSDTTGALVLKTGASGTTAVTVGADQSVTFAGSQTFSGGTANGVLYLNGSKVVTSGSALWFDGTNFGVGTGGNTLNHQSVVYKVGANAIYQQVANGSTGLGATNGIRVGLTSAGVGEWYSPTAAISYIDNSEQMRLTSTGLGIGTSSPAYKLSVAGNTASEIAIQAVNSGIGNTGYRLQNSLRSWAIFVNDDSSGPLRFYDYTAGAERMRIDSSGNLGLGVTPSAWNISQVLEGSYGSASFGSSLGTTLAGNVYYNSGWKYKSNSTAGLFLQDSNGQHFYNGSGGAANSAVSFQEIFKVFSDGASVDPEGFGSKYLRLNVSSAGDGHILMQRGGTNRWQITSGATNALQFYNYATGSESMRIDSSGNLLVGTTSGGVARVYAVASSGQAAQFDAPSGTTQQGIGRFTNTTNSAYFSIAGVGTSSVVPSWSNGSMVLETVAAGSGSMILSAYTGSLIFQTNLRTEAARIDSSGNLLVGATSSYTTYASIQVTGDNKGVAIRDSTDGSYRAIYNQSGLLYFYNGSNEGYLSAAGAWVNASDARLKSNIRNIEYGLSTVLVTQPRHFERTDVEGTYIGFIAQELQSIIPEVVSGSEKQLGVDYGSLVALAFKAIQEQQALIESLTQRIAALEGQ